MSKKCKDMKDRVLRAGESHRKDPNQPLPHITPHVFRYTFCTNMANAGMDVKTLQYLIGHFDVGVTLNIYTVGLWRFAQKTGNTPKPPKPLETTGFTDL